jgi:hypothetical protein
MRTLQRHKQKPSRPMMRGAIEDLQLPSAKRMAVRSLELAQLDLRDLDAIAEAGKTWDGRTIDDIQNNNKKWNGFFIVGG